MDTPPLPVTHPQAKRFLELLPEIHQDTLKSQDIIPPELHDHVAEALDDDARRTDMMLQLMLRYALIDRHDSQRGVRLLDGKLLYVNRSERVVAWGCEERRLPDTFTVKYLKVIGETPCWVEHSARERKERVATWNGSVGGLYEEGAVETVIAAGGKLCFAVMQESPFDTDHSYNTFVVWACERGKMYHRIRYLQDALGLPCYVATMSGQEILVWGTQECVAGYRMGKPIVHKDSVVVVASPDGLGDERLLRLRQSKDPEVIKTAPRVLQPFVVDGELAYGIQKRDGGVDYATLHLGRQDIGPFCRFHHWEILRDGIVAFTCLQRDGRWALWANTQVVCSLPEGQDFHSARLSLDGSALTVRFEERGRESLTFDLASVEDPISNL